MAGSDMAEERPLHRLLAGLRRPGAGWAGIPVGVALILGGVFGFLPILGLWMLPLGALLLSEDLPFLKRPTLRALGAVQQWWDRRRGRAGAP